MWDIHADYLKFMESERAAMISGQMPVKYSLPLSAVFFIVNGSYCNRARRTGIYFRNFSFVFS